MPGEGVFVRACIRVPQPNLLPTPTGKRQTIRTERNAIDRTRMPGEGAFVCTCIRVPTAEPSRPELPLASVRPSGLNDTLKTTDVCPGEGVFVRTCIRVPQPHRPVRTRTGKR